MKLRIAVVAHGRFHAFDLARELRRLGHDVTLLSNYPAWAAERFGIDRRGYRGFRLHGVVERLVARLAPALVRRTESVRHRWFGRWAARALEGQMWDVVHCWSGVSEELLRSTRVKARCRALMRGSAHVAEQAAILETEESRVGVKLERPSAWMVARETREYELADRIVVLSEFARASFAKQGVDDSRVVVLPLGVDVEQFRPSREALAARLERVRSGEPLTVLYVGALSARKGLFDLVETARMCGDLAVRFVLVGSSLPETSAILPPDAPNIEAAGRREQGNLPEIYARADLFLFPTLEDGFGMVLSQAQASGLVILSTGQSAAPDLMVAGAAGWVLPMRSAAAFAERIRWCDTHREQLALMLERAATGERGRSWSAVAGQFADAAGEWIDAPRRREVAS